MCDDFFEFLVAFFRKGELLITGLFGMVVAAVIGIAWPDNVPWSVWFFIGDLALFASCFLVWRDTRKELKAAKDLLDGIPEMEIGYDQNECIKQLPEQRIYCVTVGLVQGGTFASVSEVKIALAEGKGLEMFHNAPFAFKDVPQIESVICNMGDKIRANIMVYQNRQLQLILVRERPTLAGNGPHEIALRATGNGAKPDIKRFRIGIRNNDAFMEPID
jgi:hypothetical protein